MRARRMLIAVVACLALPHLASAGTETYTCTLLTVQEVDEWGLLQESSEGRLGTSGQFTVDRRSGAIRGDFLANADARSVQVIHPGSASMAFAVVSNFRDSYAEMLWIKEQSDSPTKPFVALSAFGVMTGTCE